MHASALLHLLQLSSPSLPIGAYSYSQGLEAAIEHGRVNSEASARAWIGEALHEVVARFEAPIFARLVAAFEAWARGHLAGFSMAAAAKGVGASERTLERKVRQTLGKSPLEYVQDLRVEQATHLLATTSATVEDVAEKVGYQAGVTLRTLLRKRTGRGVREIRDPAPAVSEREPGRRGRRRRKA